TIDVVREEGLVEKAESDGRYFMDRLLELKQKHSIICDVRGQGLMIGMELGLFRDTADQELCMVVVALCERSYVHMTYSYFEPVIRFIPALTITRQQIDRAIAVLDESLSRACSGKVRATDLFSSNPYSRAFMERLTGK